MLPHVPGPSTQSTHITGIMLKQRDGASPRSYYAEARCPPQLLNKHDKTKVNELHAAEDALHHKALSRVTDRVDLTAGVEKILGW